MHVPVRRLGDTDCLPPLLCHPGAKICAAGAVAETTLNGAFNQAVECSATGACSAFPTISGQEQCDSSGQLVSMLDNLW